MERDGRRVVHAQLRSWASKANVLAAGGDAKWYGVAGYFNYAINFAWRWLCGRVLRRQDGCSTGAAKVTAVTATLGYAPTKSFELRLGGRYDMSDEEFFLRTPTESSTTTRRACSSRASSRSIKRQTTRIAALRRTFQPLFFNRDQVRLGARRNVR